MLHTRSLGNCSCSSEVGSGKESTETPLLVSIEERKAEDLGHDYEGRKKKNVIILSRKNSIDRMTDKLKTSVLKNAPVFLIVR